jgi:purine-nucleoside phosphorylase
LNQQYQYCEKTKRQKIIHVGTTGGSSVATATSRLFLVRYAWTRKEKNQKEVSEEIEWQLAVKRKAHIQSLILNYEAYDIVTKQSTKERIKQLH